MGSFDMFTRENGMCLFQFGMEKDCTRVLEGGRWTLDNRLIVMRRWEKEPIEHDLLTNIPICIRLLNLSIEY